MADPPPPHVLAAFGAEGPVEPLAGGQGESFRAGRIVLKRTGNPAEAQWIGGLFASLEGPGFRVPRPVPSRAGGWEVSGGLRSNTSLRGPRRGATGVAGPKRWRPAGPSTARSPVNVSLHSSGRPLMPGPSPTASPGRADGRAAGALPDSIARLERLPRPVDLPSQPVHGDFAGNVLFAEDGPPCVIDFSSYWRPALSSPKRWS